MQLGLVLLAQLVCEAVHVYYSVMSLLLKYPLLGVSG